LIGALCKFDRKKPLTIPFGFFFILGKIQRFLFWAENYLVGHQKWEKYFGVSIKPQFLTQNTGYILFQENHMTKVLPQLYSFDLDEILHPGSF
jgi:hypothetical protein